MKTAVEIKGLDKMLARFNNAPAQLDTIKRGMLETGAMIIMRTAKKTAPIKDGILRSSIAMGGLTSSEVRVGTNLNYAKFQEYGTGIYAGKGMIRPKRAKILAWKSGGKWIFARAVKGVKPTRFMKAGFDGLQGKLSEIKAQGRKIIKVLSF